MDVHILCPSITLYVHNTILNNAKLMALPHLVKYHIIPYRRAVRECEGLGAHLLVFKRGPNHNDLPLWLKSASKSDW